MAAPTIYTGKASSIKVGSTDIENIEEVTIKESVKLSEHSILGSEYDIHSVGTHNWSISFTKLADSTFFTDLASIDVGTQVDLTVTVTTGKTYTGNVTVQQSDISINPNKTVTYKFDATGNGTLTKPTSA